MNKLDTNLVQIGGHYLLRTGYLLDADMIHGAATNPHLARTTDKDLAEVMERYETIQLLLNHT